MVIPISTGSTDADDYLQGLLSANLSKGSIALYGHILKSFISYTEKDVRDINSSDLENYSRHLSTKLSASVHKLNLIVIRKYLSTRGYISETDLKRIRMPRVEQRLPEYLSNDQAAQLLRAVQYNIRDHAFVSTLLYTGVRCAELINLDIDDIDFQENIVKVRQGKGKKDRIIPLAPQLRDAIRNYIKYRMDTNQNTIDGSKALFVTSRCNPKRLSGTTIRKLLIQYAAKAGLSHLHPHKLRHTALTEIYRKTKDLYYTSLIAGHSGVAITQRYAHSDPNYLKEIYNKSNIGYGATQQSNIPKPELPQQQRPDRTGYQ